MRGTPEKWSRMFFWVQVRQIEGKLFRKSEEEEVSVVGRDQGNFVFRM